MRRRSFYKGKNGKAKNDGFDSEEKVKKNDRKVEMEKFNWRLVKYEALHECLKDNKFILDCYRFEW